MFVLLCLQALKENYLQPLLERHCLSSTKFPTSCDPFCSQVISTTTGPSPSLDIPAFASGTMRSTKSIEARRPFLSLSAGSTSANIRYATPVSSDHGHDNLYSRASHRASEAHPAASTDHLPIAARFARRVSIDSPPTHESDGSVMGGSTNTTRTAVEDTGEDFSQGRRDISGGSGGTGTTAVDSEWRGYRDVNKTSRSIRYVERENKRQITASSPLCQSRLIS